MAEAKRANDFYDKYPGGPEKVDELLELASQLKSQGIDPVALLDFAILVRKNNRDPLTDDQGFKVHEMLVQKISPAEIYQRMFGAAG